MRFSDRSCKDNACNPLLCDAQALDRRLHRTQWAIACATLLVGELYLAALPFQRQVAAINRKLLLFIIALYRLILLLLCIAIVLLQFVVSNDYCCCCELPLLHVKNAENMFDFTRCSQQRTHKDHIWICCALCCCYFCIFFPLCLEGSVVFILKWLPARLPAWLLPIFSCIKCILYLYLFMLVCVCVCSCHAIVCAYVCALWLNCWTWNSNRFCIFMLHLILA